jgi:alpha-tubulin suppressor-like RCC1 family protein
MYWALVIMGLSKSKRNGASNNNVVEVICLGDVVHLLLLLIKAIYCEVGRESQSQLIQ